MDLTELLKGKDDCGCKKKHTCDIKNVTVKSGAIEELPSVSGKYSRIILVADKNTFATCGERVEKLLGEKIEKRLIFESDRLLIPNEKALDRIDRLIDENTDLILGVGSGVINDLCKFESNKNGLPYHIIATAPSMDGYASVGAALITDDMKTTFNAHVPDAIIADVDILKTAPMDMIRSGFGDIIGKYSALNDWKLSFLVNGEYFCPYVYRLVFDTVVKTEKIAEKLQERDEEAIKTLMEALIIVGIAMSYTGNSRPASGSEHHLSHYFEITGILNKRKYFLHGIDVAYSMVKVAEMHEKIMKYDSFPDSTSAFDREKWEENIRKNYTRAADGVISLQDKCGYYIKDYARIYREKWKEIRGILSDMPSCERIKAILKKAGLDYEEYYDLYGEKLIQDCCFFAKDLKDRYTFLWIYYLMFYK